MLKETDASKSKEVDVVDMIVAEDTVDGVFASLTLHMLLVGVFIFSVDLDADVVTASL